MDFSFWITYCFNLDSDSMFRTGSEMQTVPGHRRQKANHTPREKASHAVGSALRNI